MQSLAAAPALIVNEADIALVRPVLVAVRV